MFDHEQETTFEPKGFRGLPVSWFYVVLVAFISGWVLSIAELVCIFYLGRPK